MIKQLVKNGDGVMHKQNAILIGIGTSVIATIILLEFFGSMIFNAGWHNGWRDAGQRCEFMRLEVLP